MTKPLLFLLVADGASFPDSALFSCDLGRYRARSYAQRGYPFNANAFSTRSVSCLLFSSVDGMRAERRVSERIVASLWLSGAWEWNWIY